MEKGVDGPIVLAAYLPILAHCDVVMNEAGPGPSLACFSNCTRSLVLFHSSSSFRSVLETPGASCSHGLSRLATRGLEVVADATVHGCYLLREQLLEDQPRENNASRLCCLPKVGHLIRAT
jgi:hypothetical protein